jgi:hypothetical protein
MTKRALTYLEQAAKARRLAKSIPDDQASTKLVKLAEEYEALAREDEQEREPKDTQH